MRIAIDAHALSGPAQGVSTYIEHIARAIAERSPQSELLLLVDRLPEEQRRWPDNIRLVEWTGGRAWRLGPGARFQLRRLGCSVFHCSYFLPLPSPVPTLLTLHDLLPETHPQFFSRRFVLAARYGFRLSAHRAHHLFTPSHYARASIIERYRIDPERISITPGAVDIQRFNQSQASDPAVIESTLRSRDYLLLVGRFDPRKDHNTVINAYAQLFGRSCGSPRLVLAGSGGRSEQQIREQIVRLRLEHRILVLKNLPAAHMPTLYAHALATISASHGEGFGLPMVEAMAAGSPVICADNTAQTEVVKGYGLMFATGDSAALAEAMQRIVGNLELQAELRNKGLARARDYSWGCGAAVFLEQAQRVSTG